MARYTYVMSDIHGQYDAFMEMIDQIQFTDDDELYIVGDLIDRGPKSIECIKWVANHDNVLAMLGNHELLFLDNYTHDDEGIYDTITKARDTMKPEAVEAIAAWISDMPECKLVKVDGKNFYLCHTQALNQDYFKDNLTERLFPDYGRYKKYYNTSIKDITSIFGHIPTMQMRKWYEQENSSKMWKNCDASIIDIDCGAGYPEHGGCLGCLRLNDMREYYVEL